MKKRGIYFLLSFIFVLSISFTFALTSNCDLTATLLNQDPVKATPGDYVKLVFQIDGLASASCGQVSFELLEKYPISFDPNQTHVYNINSGTFVKDYPSEYLATYKVRVDPNAIDGDNPIEVRWSSGITKDSFESKQFNLSVQDVRTNFEIYPKSFSPTTGIVTFEILNVGKADVKAIALEIPSENNTIQVNGAKTNILGDLDSNEYTTADFEVVPKDSIINFLVHYTDEAQIRRTTDVSVNFDPKEFLSQMSNQPKSSNGKWIILVIIVLAVIFYLYRKKKKKHSHMH